MMDRNCETQKALPIITNGTPRGKLKPDSRFHYDGDNTPNFLKPPSDMRGRLTSTPNIVCTDKIMHTQSFSPQNTLSPSNHRAKRIDRDDFSDLKSVLFHEEFEADSAIGDSQSTMSFEDLCIHDVIMNEDVTTMKRKRSESTESNDTTNINNNSTDSNESFLSGFRQLSSDSNNDEFKSPLRIADANSQMNLRQDSGLGSSILSSGSCGLFSPNKRSALDYTPDGHLKPILSASHKEEPVFKNLISFSPVKYQATSPSAIATRLFMGCDFDRNGDVSLAFEDSAKKKLEFCESSQKNTFKTPTPKKFGQKSSITTPPSHIIGSLIGVNHVDIITQLHTQSLCHVISKIFANIRRKDVFRCSKVCRTWNQACHSYPFLKQQLKELKKTYLENEKQSGLENFTVTSAENEALLKTPTKQSMLSKRNMSKRSGVLSSLQTKAKRSPVKHVLLPTTPSGKNRYVATTDKFEHNQKVRKTLNYGEKLRPCPHCGWTAKIYNSNNTFGQCYNPNCRFRFCMRCQANHSPTKKCNNEFDASPEKCKVPIAGSKKSMRNIKRRLR